MLLVGDRIPGPCGEGTILFIDDQGIRLVQYDNGDEALLLPYNGEFDALYFPYDRFVRPDRTAHLKAGSRILAAWETEWFYPATIRFVNSHSGRVVVEFDDGDWTVVKADQMQPMQCWADGTVQCRLADGDVYFSARILQKHGDRMIVEYEDPRLGSEWVTTAQLRLPAKAFAKPLLQWVDVFSAN